MNQYEVCFDLENSKFSIFQPKTLEKYMMSTFANESSTEITAAETIKNYTIFGGLFAYLGFLIFNF